MRHFMEQFGPCLQWPWTKLTDVPDLDDALVDRIADQSDAQAAGLSIRELERIRDDNLIGIMEALERTDASGWGAGALLCEAKGAMRERSRQQRTARNTVSGDGRSHDDLRGATRFSDGKQVR